MSNNIEHRLDFVTSNIFKNQVELANLLDVNRGQITQLKKGHTGFGIQTKVKFNNIGINAEWVTEGKGDIFTDDEVGRRLQKKYYDKIYNNSDQRNIFGIIKRLKEIQKKHYPNFQFEIKFEAEVFYVADHLNKMDDLGLKYKDIIEKEGFCIEYILDGIGDMYDLFTEQGKKRYDDSNGMDDVILDTPAASLTKRDLLGMRNIKNDSISPYISEDEILIPYYEASVQAGIPTDVFEEPIKFIKAIGVNKNSCFQVKVAGDSMIDFGIYDGDMVILDRNAPVKDGKIVLARIEDQFTLKRLDTVKNEPALIAGNSKYKPIILRDNIDIIGVMIKLIRDY